MEDEMNYETQHKHSAIDIIMLDDIKSNADYDSNDSDSHFDLFEVDGYMVDLHDDINDKSNGKGKTFLELFSHDASLPDQRV
jgi:hypothetical protein